MEERIIQKDILMTEKIKGRYNPIFPFIKKLLLRNSPTGLYRSEESMVKLMKSDFKQMDASLNFAKELSLKYEINPDISAKLSAAYKTASSDTSKFYLRLSDIHENGGPLGKNLVSTDIMGLFLTLLPNNQNIIHISDGLNIGGHIGQYVIKMCSHYMNDIKKIGKNIIDDVDKNYQEMGKQRSDFLCSFWSGLNQNSHYL